MKKNTVLSAIFLIGIIIIIIFYYLGYKCAEDKQSNSNIGINIREEEEITNMKREFCAVVGDNDFILKNVSGELYSIDISLRGDFKDGDEVLLIYTDRVKGDNGVYNANVYGVYHDDSTLVKPSN